LKDLLGTSPAFAAVRDELARLLARPVASSKRLPPVLIQGETGTGKGLVAHTIHGMGPRASAAFVADITVEMGAQVAFTLLGLAALVRSAADPQLVHWSWVGIVTLAGLLGVFLLAQRLGVARWLFGRWGRHAPGWRASLLLRGLEIETRLRSTYQSRARVAAALTIHTLAWVLGTGEAWIALHQMRAGADLGAVVALESLIFVARSVVFFVPASLGVQEASYALVGAALGIAPEFALALSLVKRARELCLGVPALVGWQLAEGKRAWRPAYGPDPALRTRLRSPS